jgi:hypothetical protein
MFEWKVTFGDVLTFGTILLSAAGLAWTWNHDILAREREQASEVRKAAALALAKMERLPQSTNMLFDELDQAIVEASDLLSNQKHDEQAAKAARDYFWKTAGAARVKRHERVMDEQIESAYVALYSYMTDARSIFQSTARQLRTAEEQAFEKIRDDCQREILSTSKWVEYDPAILGNKCRNIVEAQRQSYLKTEKPILAKVEERLEPIVVMKDHEIFSGLRAKKL